MQNVKGTHDLLPLESANYDAITELFSNIATVFGYHSVNPPVIEHAELFSRNVGESSDIVRKEMYNFFDKGGRELALRPEFTAGIIRLIVQNKLYVNNELPLKYYYVGPVFRYDRPQLGRYRQFMQFGVESVGLSSPVNDAEIIAMSYSMLKTLGLNNIALKINTLGDDESRNNYREALKSYFTKYIDNMCEDCKQRLISNPLRILDCKVKEDQQYISNAPKISAYLSANAKARFEMLLNNLKTLNIPYEIDEGLVRGLDYYSDTVFEFHYTNSKGVNYGAIGGGGHYDKLVKQIGGPDMPGFGFSFGVERIYNTLNDEGLLPIKQEAIDIYVMPIGIENQIYGLKIANQLRMNGFLVDMCLEQCKIGNMFKRAEKKGAKFALIIGENEIKNNIVIIKNIASQEQQEIKQEDLLSYFINLTHSCHCHEYEGGDNCNHDNKDCCCHNKDVHQ